MTLLEILRPDCALFLDFDGTLVDIAPEPHAVQVPDGLREDIRRLQRAMGGAVAVVSGRPLAQIDDFLAPLRLPAAGVHGSERRRADGDCVLLAAQPLQEIERAARRLAREHPQLLVETKRSSIALHYRQAPELQQAVLDAMQAAVDASAGMTLLRGKMVAEAKPAGADKGGAVEAFLREPPFAGRTPVFIGDDVTDEAGFLAAQRLGGVGIKVGEGPTAAVHRLPDPAELRRQLHAAAAQLEARAG